MHAMTISFRRMLVLLAVIATLMTALLAATASADQPQPEPSAEDCRVDATAQCGESFFGWFRQPTVLEFDISEDMTRFAFDADVVHEDGLPAYGSAFVTQGYFYPAGTLDGSNGVMPDGSPEFPDQVLGEWTCYGYYVGDGAHTTTGAMVISTQILDFGETLGGTTLVTSGYEIADLNVPVSRAITGGTGDYTNARGEQSQQMLGLNATDGVVLRAKLVVQKH